MQITPNIPDAGLTAVPRKESAPVLGVSPTPGVADSSRTPDARSAVLAAMPVTHALDSERTRESLAVRDAEMQEEIVTSLVRQTFASGTERASRPLSLAASGMMLPALSAWLKENVSKRAGTVRWPANAQTFPDDLPPQSVMNLMVSLYAALASSPLFAAQRLSRTLGQITAAPIRKTASDDTPAGAIDDPVVDLLARIRSVAHSLESSEDAVGRNLREIAADGESAPQSARLLIEGQLLWQGEIAPGVPLKIERRDAWRSNPQRVGEVQRGAALDLDLMLPNLGPLRVEGAQWGDDLVIRVASPTGDPRRWFGWSTLASALRQQFPSIRIEDGSHVD